MLVCFCEVEFGGSRVLPDDEEEEEEEEEEFVRVSDDADEAPAGLALFVLWLGTEDKLMDTSSR